MNCKMTYHIQNLKDLIEVQAQDEGLWFLDPLCSEAYLQAALRRLHTKIEDMLEEYKNDN